MSDLPATSARRQTLETGTTVTHLDTVVAGKPVTITVCEWQDGHKLFKAPTTKSRESLSDLILDLERQAG